MLLVVVVGIPLLLGLGATPRAQSGTGHSSGTHVGDVLGDLIHIKRHPLTGQPILQQRWVALPNDQFGWDYCPIPVDAAGFEIPFLDLSCDPDPLYASAVVPVDYFGRLSGGRTQERNLRMHFDEAINGIKSSETVTLDEAARLRLGTDCTSLGVCASWRSIDSPQENMAIYRWVLKYGHIQTDPSEVDTSMGGDPAAGTVYHPALDGSDWAKFMGPVRDLLPGASPSQCFSGGFVAACAAPQALTSIDFILASGLLSGAADKTGRITPDLVQYVNRILKITEDTPGTLATLNKLPALIRDDQGVITPAPAGLAWPASELFVDFSVATYLRSGWFDTQVSVLQPSGGAFVPTTVNLTTWLNFINGPMTQSATAMPSFIASTSDALRTVQFIHEYAIPADLWATTGATTTTVTSVVVPYSDVDQNVTLNASVVATSAGSVNGSVTFFVRDALSTPIGATVTAPVVTGAATAVYVLPGGTAPQTLTLVALFTPSDASTTSQGSGTLTITSGGGPCVPLTVLPAALPAGAVGASYSQTFTSDGVAPTLYTLIGTLPAGLSFSVATISGVPTAAGSYPLRIDAVDANGCTGSRTYTLTITQLVSIITGSGEGTEGVVRLFKSDGTAPAATSTPTSFIPFPGFMNGIRVALGDVTNDGTPDAITALGPGGGPQIRVFSGANGQLVRDFMAFANWSGGGLFLAVGDVNHDGIRDIIAAQGWGAPLVRVFSGTDLAVLHDFSAGGAFGSSGARVASADVNGDGFDDIVVASGPGVTPIVRVFSGATGAVLRDLTGFDADLPNGMFVAAGDVNGDHLGDIIIGAGEGTTSRIRVFSGATGAQVTLFEAFEPWRIGGARVASADINGDGRAEIIAAAGPGDPPVVHVFDGATGLLISEFPAYAVEYYGGVYVGVIR